MSSKYLIALLVCALLWGCRDSPSDRSTHADEIVFDVLHGESDGTGPKLIQTEVPRSLPRFHLVDEEGKGLVMQIEKKDQLTNTLSLLASLPAATMEITAKDGQAESAQTGMEIHFVREPNEQVEEWANHQDPLVLEGVLISNQWHTYWLQSVTAALDVLPAKVPTESSVGTLKEQRLLGIEGGSGIGSLGVYNYDGISRLDDYETKRITVTENGPVYVKVRVDLTGVPVRKEKLDLAVTYAVYRDKPYVDVTFQVVGKTNLNLKLAIGLPRFEDSEFVQGVKGQTHFAYTFGGQGSDHQLTGSALLIKEPFVTDTYNDDEL
nr:DUF4861 family protein [Saprospiraceae bacterium]